MANNKPLTPQRKDEVFAALGELAPLYARRMLHWTAHTNTLVGPVASNTATYEQQAMFIVRLAGIVGDLRHRFRAPVAIGDPADLVAEFRAKLAAAITALHAALTEDELLWLELRRHEQCHPALDGYRPDVSMDADWNSRVSKMLDGKIVSLEDTHRRCRVLEETAGGFGGLIAAIAQRTFILISNVHGRMLPLMTTIDRS
jgi:hypothetical protein